ncbi:MAG: hypothetical protein KBC05_00465 [Candidatus Hydrogenedentes bacterium]|nr:hypothetical protein [Candidatus Hydrogenedentota bacterium]
MTTSELLTIVGITVAINIGFVTFLAARDRGKGKKLKKAARAANDALRYVHKAITETVGALQALDIKVKDLQNQTYRLLDSSSVRKDIRIKIVTLLHDKDLRLDKTLQELSLFSSNPVVRFSACKMLAMNCGDSNSLEKIVLMAEYETDAQLRDQYRSYIEQLKTRLDTRGTGP